MFQIEFFSNVSLLYGIFPKYLRLHLWPQPQQTQLGVRFGGLIFVFNIWSTIIFVVVVVQVYVASALAKIYTAWNAALIMCFLCTGIDVFLFFYGCYRLVRLRYKALKKKGLAVILLDDVNQDRRYTESLERGKYPRG